MQSLTKSSRELGNQYYTQAKQPNLTSEQRLYLLNNAKQQYEKALLNANQDEDKASCNKNLGLTFIQLAELEKSNDSKLVIYEKSLKNLENSYFFGKKCNKESSWLDEIFNKGKTVTKFILNILKDLPNEIRLNKYFVFNNKISNDFTDAKACFCLYMTRVLFAVYLSEKEKKNYKVCLNYLADLESIVKSGIYFTKKMKSDNSLEFEELTDFEERVFIEHCSTLGQQYYSYGKELMNQAINNEENFDIKLIHSALDEFKQTIICSKEKDIELEAKASERLGFITMKILKNKKKAREYFHNSITLGISLAPKNVTYTKWFTRAQSNFKKLQEDIISEENQDNEARDAPLRIKFAKELETLKENYAKTWQEYLKFIWENYKPKCEINNYTLDEDKLKTENMKKTLIKMILFYHPDKQSNYDLEWQFFSREITKYLTAIFELTK